MSQSPPSTLGKYQIIREIARSNDIVYEAYDPVMNRRVAVKELSMPGGATQQQKDDRVKRFLREARAAGSLVHPNIVTIYEVSEDAGRRYLAMEYLDGQNLRNLLDTKGFIEPKRAVEIAIEVLKGLDFAHSHGVIHRDIKPDNIQLLENSEVKITDFGIARLTFEPNLTMDGQVFGTPSYMSPEQINGRDIDARSDLFSVGVILYEMVAGQKPFTGDSVVSITYAIMNTDPGQPNQCGPALWQVVRQSLDKSPQLRWGSAKEMRSALEDVLRQMNSNQVIVATPTAQPYGGPQLMPGPPPIQAGLTPYGTPMPGTVMQQPYGQPAPGPYGQPYGQPYQPQTGAYGQQQQPYIPVPVYYPPAPRGPLVSAETKSFLGRLFMAVVILGTIVSLVVMAIVKGAEVVNQKPTSTATQQPQGRPATTNPPIQNNTARSTSEPVKVNPPPATTQQDAAEAVHLAMIEPDVTKRRGLWSRASRLWSEVVEPNPRQLNKFAVESFLSSAQESLDSGQTLQAIEAVYEAQGFAQGDPELEAQVEAAQRVLGR